jgi:hypothetical protein
MTSFPYTHLAEKNLVRRTNNEHRKACGFRVGAKANKTQIKRTI